MSNAFADIQTVYRTNYDNTITAVSIIGPNIHFISVECKLYI